MANPLEVSEGVQYQFASEVQKFSLNVAKWTSAPLTPSVNVYDESVDSEVTLTVMPTNTVTASNSILDMSPLKALTAGHTYRVCVNFAHDGNVRRPYFRVVCPKE